MTENVYNLHEVPDIAHPSSHPIISCNYQLPTLFPNNSHPTSTTNMPTQPLELWAHWGAPNPWKVCMIFEILALPYTLHFLEFNEVKNDSHITLNPNGRLPTLKDPNTGIVLWEVRRKFMSDVICVLVTNSSTVRCDYSLPNR
jgi:hypothetical protein